MRDAMGRRRSSLRTGAVFNRIMALMAGCAFVCAAARAEESMPRRVISANLCADQLVLALADPAQIASLGRFAREPSISFLASQARRYPANRGTAEEMIDLRADLVLLGSFDNRYLRAVLEKRGIAIMILDPWISLEQGRGQIRAVAERLGHRARGEALIGRIDEGIRRLEARAARRSKKPSALVLHRRGYVLQSGVLAELAQKAGLRNAASSLGLAASSLVPIERLMMTPPDFLIVAQDISAPSDQGEALLMHPALLRVFPSGKRLIVPDRLAICAGPSTPALIERLMQEIEAKTGAE